MVASRGEEMVEAVQCALAQLDALARRPHSRRDICSIIDSVAARMEEFLRTAAFPAASRHDKLYKLITDLGSLGLKSNSISDMDALRGLYNQSKHDPSMPLGLAHVRATVARCVDAFREVTGLGVSSIDAAADTSLSHHLWVAAWDHLMGGETEVAIVLPSAHWTHIGTFDNFHLDYDSWDALKLALAAHANFKWGEEHFDPGVWATFAEDTDFLNAGVWDGGYGDLLHVLARFNDSTKMRAVMSGLQRARNAVSIGAAIVTAAIDVARSSADALEAREFAQRVVARAATEYALTCDAAHPAVVQMAAFITSRPHDTWRRLSGPLIVDKEWAANFPKIEGPLPIVIDRDRIAFVASAG